MGTQLEPLIYNYFSNLEEWNLYVKGNWKGKGISMWPSMKEPYESNQETKVKLYNKNNQLFSEFRRAGIRTKLEWKIQNEILCDRIFLVDSTNEWKAEIQTMTNTKLHLHVLPSLDNSKIMFSGIVEKYSYWF